MADLSLETEKTKLERKLKKERGAEEAEKVMSELERCSKEELEARLLDLSKTGQGLINIKKADTALQALKDQVTEGNRVHNENIRRNKDHQRLVSLVISEKFGDDLMDVKQK